MSGAVLTGILTGGRSLGVSEVMTEGIQIDAALFFCILPSRPSLFLFLSARFRFWRSQPPSTLDSSSATAGDPILSAPL
jgi:hypothetical protein